MVGSRVWFLDGLRQRPSVPLFSKFIFNGWKYPSVIVAAAAIHEQSAFERNMINGEFVLVCHLTGADVYRFILRRETFADEYAQWYFGRKYSGNRHADRLNKKLDPASILASS